MKRMTGKLERAKNRPAGRYAKLVGLTVGDALERLGHRHLQEIRRQIEAGTYLTEDKLDVVYDRLVEVLNRSRRPHKRASA
jgi:hypothetical protein